MSKATNVTDAKPKTSGAVRFAPYGTALPTSATAELSDAWKTVGYLSEDGYKNTNGPESSSVKEWGGDTVLDGETSKEDKFKFKMIEALNENVLKVVYGENNVIVAEDGTMTVHANAREHEKLSMVIDEILRGGKKMRTVAANTTLTELAEIEHKKGNTIGYDVTVSCKADEKHKVTDSNGDEYFDTHVTYYSA